MEPSGGGWHEKVTCGRRGHGARFTRFTPPAGCRGETFESIPADFPDLERDGIAACLTYAARQINPPRLAA
ncbi:MAG: DUF433 domain-containing protein [Myxococcales bacterium]|nr:DUF433 domain-containing protein [Myxococcales bacterium]